MFTVLVDGPNKINLEISSKRPGANMSIKRNEIKIKLPKVMPLSTSSLSVINEKLKLVNIFLNSWY